MPAQWVSSDPTALRGGLGVEPVVHPSPSLGETVGAAFRLENPVVNLVGALYRESFPPDPDYIPFDDEAVKPHIGDHADKYTFSRSARESAAITARIQQEEKDQQTRQAAGAGGFLASVFAGSLDPTLALPGAILVRSVRGGYSVARSAALSATALGGQVGAQEAVLQATQETRTAGETAMAVGTATILGGLIGAGASRLLSAAERRVIENAMSVDRAKMDVHANGVLVGFHGTAKDFEGFDFNASRNVNEQGAVFFSPSPDAARVWGDRVIEAQIDPGKQRVFDIGAMLRADDAETFIGEMRQAHHRYVNRNPEAATFAGEQTAEGVTRADASWEKQLETIMQSVRAGENSVPFSSLVTGAVIAMAKRDGLDTAIIRGMREGGGAKAKPPLDQIVVFNPDVIRPAAGAAPVGVGPGVGASVGAAAADVRQLEMFPSIPGTGKLSVTRRVFGAESLESRRVMADLAESPYRFRENEQGVSVTQGPALDRQARMEINGTRVRISDELERQFSDYRFGQPDLMVPRLRARLDDFRGAGDGKLSYADFKREVSIAMQQQDQHAIPQVAAVAQFIRKNLFDPWGVRAEQSVEGFEKLEPFAGESYFGHIWNKALIRARRPEFTNRLVDLYRNDQENKRAIQQRLDMAGGQLKSWEDQIGKLEQRLERLAASQTKVGARLDERAMEVARAEKRAGVLEERAVDIKGDILEIEEFIADMRAELRDPALLARVDQMEREARALARADRPMTEAQLRSVEQEELSGILTGTIRKAAEIVTGRRSPPKAPSFITWLVSNGGLRDDGGEVSSVLGGTRTRPGLINSRGRGFDQMGEKLQNEFPGSFPARDETGGGAPGRDEIIAWIDDALRGRQPGWWVEEMATGDRELMEADAFARVLEEAFDRAGVDVKNVRDVAKVLRDDRDAPMRLDDLDRITAEMEAVGQDIPVSGRRARADENLAILREDIASARAMIDRARNARDAREQRLRITQARGEEAEMGAQASRGRLGVLEDRLLRGEAREELILDAITLAQRMRDEVRGKIEEDIGRWDGTSADEAKAALAAREKYIAQREAEGKPRKEGAPRLTMADSAIDRTVKRIRDADYERSIEDLRDRAKQTVDRILGSPDGRLAYDEHLGGPRVGYHAEPAPRGSLANRALHVSNAWARDWIEDDIEQVVALYLRTVIPDVLLSERFGDVEMTNAFRAINEDYARLADATKPEKERNRLAKERDAVIRDVAAVRDRVRGIYGWSPDTATQNMARVAVAAKSINNMTSMGVAAISSLPDLAGIVFRYGLTSTFRDGWAPFFRHMTGGTEAWGKFKTEMRALGIGVETAINARQHSLDDVTDVYRPQSRFERALQGANDKFFIANLLAPLTDMEKVIAAHVVTANVLRATKAASEGKASKKIIGNLAESGIDMPMAGRIWQQFQNRGGEIVDGVHLPNTKDWTDRAAADAFNGAVARETDIAVVTPGQEKVLWMSGPTLSLLGQFKAFTAAATERILIANIQRRDSAALSGLMFSIGLGMLSYKLNSFFGGQDTSKRPQDWVKEGISRAGLLGWFEDGNALAAKASRGSVDVYRLIGADKPVSRFASRSAADMLLGPTWGKIESLPKITGALASGEWSSADTRAVRRLLPLQNLFWLRGALNQVEAGANGAFGIPERRPQ